MFKEQKVASCLYKAVALLALMTCAHTYRVITRFVDNQEPEPVINGEIPEPTVIGSKTVDHNQMNALTCQILDLTESISLRCKLGYELSYIFTKQGKEYTFSAGPDTSISEVITADKDTRECVKGVANVAPSPNFAAVLTACGDQLEALFAEPKDTGIILNCVTELGDGETADPIVVNVDRFTISSRRALDLI